MNVDRFLVLRGDPSKFKADLVSIRENGIAKNAMDHVSLAQRVLDECCAGWRSTECRDGVAASLPR